MTPEARTIARTLRPFVQILAVTAGLALILKVFVLEAIYIPSPSMESTILPGDFLLVNKLAYGGRTLTVPFLNAGFLPLPKLGDVKRGDVIMFELPGSPRPARPTFFVKRCVAVPGDEISFHAGFAWINGSPFAAPDCPEMSPTTVPRRGDVIRLDSGFSPVWKQVIEREGHSVEVQGAVLIDGKPSSSYAIQKNYLFVLGDNLDHSYDSRHWGFLPEENVQGRAMIVYWSMEGFDVRWDRLGTLVR